MQQIRKLMPTPRQRICGRTEPTTAVFFRVPSCVVTQALFIMTAHVLPSINRSTSRTPIGVTSIKISLWSGILIPPS